MEIQPVKRGRLPSFPTSPEIQDRPSLLYAVPSRWRTNPTVLMALTSLPALAAAARSETPISVASKTDTLVAPLFVHGSGMGSFGCRVVNPPAFLSETEAMQVIIDEAKKAGLNFKADQGPIGNAWISKNDPYWPFDIRPLVSDGRDKASNISFLFVSAKDCRNLTDGTVRMYDSQALARSINLNLQQEKGIGSVALFYEPFISLEDKDDDWNMHGRKTKDQDKEELRRQVRDFVQWLKAQKVI